MKYIIPLLAFIFLFSGCNQDSNTVTLEGDLYYNWLSLGSFYGKPDWYLQDYLNSKIDNSTTAKVARDTTGAEYLQMLEDHQLLLSPYIYLRLDNKEEIILFLDPEDYRQFTDFTYADLITNKQKVRVTAKAVNIWDGAYWNKSYRCTSVRTVEVADGQTMQLEKKFKIKDYR